MDGREAMALPGGSSSFYVHRGEGFGSVTGTTQTAGLRNPPEFTVMVNPLEPTVKAQTIFRGRGERSTFAAESSLGNLPSGNGAGSQTNSSEPVKKKRGRPRKYAPDGSMALGLSPVSAKAKKPPPADATTPPRAKGRPPGSGRKQQLALLGGWMNSSAGTAFAPFVMRIEAGEDIVAKILSFSQQRPRAVCVMSGTGAVSSLTLREPASTAVMGPFEGRYQILSLSGSYLVDEDGDPENRTGGLGVSLSTPHGHVIGGAAVGLVADGPVQVVLCSFVYGNSKSKDKQAATPKRPKQSKTTGGGDNEATPSSAPLVQSHTTQPATLMWPISHAVDARYSSHTGIDLSR